MTGSVRHKQRWIRPLPERLINKIAAGEVVERPAAVVKELFENSLDAGADQIEIVIEKSGLKLIKIVDNGCGIGPDQIEIAFSRHATSKISDFADLDCITSYGFRGEALPSIASVSQMTMTSRLHGTDSATQIVIEGGVTQSVGPIGGSPGSSIEVANLFFNTPARRKFLKSESTEARQISRVVTAMAISAPHAGVNYTLNDRHIFSLPKDQPMVERVTSLLTPGKKMVEIEGSHDGVSVIGAIGLPDNLQANRNGQYIFLNGRFIQAASLSHAFAAGYGELIPRGRFPIGAIMITVEPGEVDVNVHPAKTEVRLAQEQAVYRAVFHTIGQSLQRDQIIPKYRSPGFSTMPSGDQPDITNTSVHSRSSAAIPGMRQNALIPPDFLGKLYRPPSHSTETPPAEKVDYRTGEITADSSPSEALVCPSAGDLPDQEPTLIEGSLRLVGRFGKLYLLFQSGTDLLIVDQHTAHERILYERTLNEIQNQAVVAQHMLLADQIELSPERFALFEELSDLLNKSGFIVSHFGGRMINVEAIPSVLTGRSPEQLIMRVLDDLSSLRKAGQDFQKAMAQSIACRAAVMSGDKLTDREAIGLVDQLMACDNRYSCPHGRPTFVRLTREDINRQFGRG